MVELSESLIALLAAPDEMGRPECPVTPTDIEEFEQTQGVALPESLKSFWQKYGARDFNSRKIFTFKTKVVFPDGKKKKADVGAIASPGKMIEARKRYVEPVYGNSGARLPDGLYPLTFDSGYGHCLIDLNQYTYGRILYIVIKAKTFGDAEYGWGQVGEVAENFEQFVAKLAPDYL